MKVPVTVSWYSPVICVSARATDARAADDRSMIAEGFAVSRAEDQSQHLFDAAPANRSRMAVGRE